MKESQAQYFNTQIQQKWYNIITFLCETDTFSLKFNFHNFSKKETATIHNNTIKQFYETDNIAIYTDVSDTETEKEIEIELVAYQYQVSEGKRTI